MSNERNPPLAAPWGFTDLVRALRESIGLIEDIVKLFSESEGILGANANKAAAKSLFVLSFEPGGMIENLAKLANGTGTNADLHAIRDRLDWTEQNVYEGFRSLQDFQFKIQTRPGGMDIAYKLGQIVEGQAYGKAAIRSDLRRLVALDLSNPHEASRVTENAQALLKRVELLNDELRNLHRLLLPAR